MCSRLCFYLHFYIYFAVLAEGEADSIHKSVQRVCVNDSLNKFPVFTGRHTHTHLRESHLYSEHTHKVSEVEFLQADN